MWAAIGATAEVARIRFSPIAEAVPQVRAFALALVDARSGQCLLLDHQIGLARSSTELRHFKHVLQGAEPLSSGSKRGEFSFPLESGARVLLIHEIKVWRRNVPQIEQRYAGSVNPSAWGKSALSIVHREGRERLLVRLPDLMSSDVLEMSWTEVTAGERIGGRLDGLALLTQASCSGARHLRLSRDFTRKLHYAQGGQIDRVLSSTTRYGGAEWLVPSQVESSGALSFAGPAASPMGYVQYSEFADWAEVVDWARGEFDVSRRVGERVRRVVQGLTEHHSGLEAKVRALIDYVQKNIRYEVEMAQSNGFRPLNSNVTLEMGKGDCKAKSKLLVEMLHTLGVKANPVLVSTFFDLPLMTALPSPRYFDHVVVRIEMDNQSIFVDPTQKSGLELKTSPLSRIPKQGLELQAGVSKPSVLWPDGQ